MSASLFFLHSHFSRVPSHHHRIPLQSPRRKLGQDNRDLVQVTVSPSYLASQRLMRMMCEIENEGFLRELVKRTRLLSRRMMHRAGMMGEVRG